MKEKLFESGYFAEEWQVLTNSRPVFLIPNLTAACKAKNCDCTRHFCDLNWITVRLFLTGMQS
jgi:hypothetical protein